MLKLHVVNETDCLEVVVLGTAKSPGPIPTIDEAYDPKSKEFILNGGYPIEDDMVAEMEAFLAVLKKYDVEVYRPEILTDVNQIFSRDIGFVIEDKFIIANVVEDRSQEIEAIDYLIDQFEPEHVIELPEHVRIEGGDVMPWNGKIFMGYSESADFEKYKVARTNRDGVEFISQTFPHWEVHAFELVKSDVDPRYNALHLDCCFQPFGKNKAVIFPEGFKNPSDVAWIRQFFGETNVIEITREEMYHMGSNFFSISPEVVVSEQRLTRINKQLRAHGMIVEEVPYFEIGKQEGLLRCTTLPLRRKPHE